MRYEPVYLHLGCGKNILPKPFINIDAYDHPGVDIVCDLRHIPLDPDSADLIYSSHVLEHFPKGEELSVLSSWVSLLRPGGLLRLSVPSFENLISIYSKSEIDSVFGPLMGGQTYEKNFHFNLFDKDSLTRILLEVGLEAIHPWDVRRVSHSGYWDFSQALTKEIPISLNLEAFKKIPESISSPDRHMALIRALRCLKTSFSRVEFERAISCLDYVDLANPQGASE